MNIYIGKCVDFKPVTDGRPALFRLLCDGKTLAFQTFHRSPMEVGKVYVVEYVITSREWQGRWYINLEAKELGEYVPLMCSTPKLDRIEDSPRPPQMPNAETEEKTEVDDGIPF